MRTGRQESVQELTWLCIPAAVAAVVAAVAVHRMVVVAYILQAASLAAYLQFACLKADRFVAHHLVGNRPELAVAVVHIAACLRFQLGPEGQNSLLQPDSHHIVPDHKAVTLSGAPHSVML